VLTDSANQTKKGPPLLTSSRIRNIRLAERLVTNNNWNCSVRAVPASLAGTRQKANPMQPEVVAWFWTLPQRQKGAGVSHVVVPGPKGSLFSQT